MLSNFETVAVDTGRGRMPSESGTVRVKNFRF